MLIRNFKLVNLISASSVCFPTAAERKEIVIYQMLLTFPVEKVNVLDAHLGGGGLVHLEMTQLWHVALDSSST